MMTVNSFIIKYLILKIHILDNTIVHLYADTVIHTNYCMFRKYNRLDHGSQPYFLFYQYHSENICLSKYHHMMLKCSSVHLTQFPILFIDRHSTQKAKVLVFLQTT
jgi:hypothetical protein